MGGQPASMPSEQRTGKGTKRGLAQDKNCTCLGQDPFSPYFLA
jgi:hypothetical protein